MRDELLKLIDEERPQVVEAVHWAARNGDRSERSACAKLIDGFVF